MLVCFSGGVDSSFLLRVAHDVLGDDAIALTTVSPTNPDEDTRGRRRARDRARRRARHRRRQRARHPRLRRQPDQPLLLLQGEPLRDLPRREAGARGRFRGSRRRQRRRPRRPSPGAAGGRASTPFAIRSSRPRSPRQRSASSAASLGLRTWDRPASPASRRAFPTARRSRSRPRQRVARGENWLRARGFRECRVRYYGSRARVEVPRDDIARLHASPLRASCEA